MAGLRRSRESVPNAIVGAARRVHLNRRDEVEQFRERPTAEWQNLAWRYYDEIGEIKYAFNYFANVASRVRLYAGYQDEASDTPVPIGEMSGISRSLVTAARYELSKLSNGLGGQPNLIRQFVLNLLVAGEAFLVGAHDQWAARSTSELKFEDDQRVRLVLSRADRRASPRYLPESAFVARVWRTHPQYSDDADSSLKGVRADCQELLLLSRIIRSSAQSRLNAGLLYVADELRFQRAADPLESEPLPDVDPFEEELTLALTEPIGTSDSPSEVVPLIVRGPAEFAETGIKKIDLSRGFDETVVKRHDQTLQRIMNGLDIPKDLITGLANVRYSNARTITEDLLKSHVEPLILLICEALTTVFLRPQLIARGYDRSHVKRVHVWYDPSEVVVKPDRSEDADKGYSRMVVSAAAWRRAHGFSESDAPTDEELVQRVALSGSVAPSTTLDFLRAVAPDLVAEAERLARESFGDPERQTGESSLGPSGDQPGPPDDPSAQPPAPGTPIGVQARPPIAPAQEPPEGSLPPVEAAQVIEALRSITAATPRRSAAVRERERRLEHALEVERRLRESLHVHLNDVVRRALERAGARTVSKVRGDGELKSMVANVPLEEAFAVVPKSRRASFALDEERLVRDTLERARAGYVSLVTKAQRQGWRALGDDVFESMTASQDEDVETSWTWLLERLVKFATDWLRKPRSPGASYVDMTTVRGATAIAGGGEPTVEHSGRAILSEKTFDVTGWDFAEGYRWVYGVSENSFEPHKRLDNIIFPTWQARELASPGSDTWPYTSHYFPGDHDGCRCDYLPIPLDPAAVNAPRRGNTWGPSGDDMPVAASAHRNGHSVVQSNRNGHNRAVSVQEPEQEVKK